MPNYLTIYVAFIGMKLGVVQSGVINIINFMVNVYNIIIIHDSGATWYFTQYKGVTV